MSTAHASGQNLDPRPHWRKTTWAMIVWTALVAAIMIAGGLNISHFGGGEVLLFILGVLVLVILGLVRALVSRDR